MSGWSDGTLVAVVVGVVVLLLWLVWVRASRLDRLHRKVAASRAVVDAQLVRRASVAAELATSGLLDPASSLVVDEAVWRSLTFAHAGDVPARLLPADLRDQLDTTASVHEAVDRAQVESDLTAALREILDDPDEVAALAEDPLGGRLLEDLAAAWYRVQLARRFHNEAVAQTQRVRRGVVVRLLRLAGHAPEPRTLELDDAWPHGLPRPGEGSRQARPGTHGVEA
ncbi:hypothetical protein [Cellulomonas xiejunii]|uniref:NUDIX hydrolase n=1 Tax=Cellulomonas xiejunii TaxID=2968083 RepID=A0ABY5KWP0_9CELL|nr:hypothetical protein [Cellulomonas xiejunii]MCC2314779.1 hypothetical protein [Cellulomonas xiejunii]MCC2323061.1 hypothetical protein [Cellulomonas xiejunii]UUI73555.1 hypothetical protein NP048_09065 [Cellulomonas xiejunii]